MAQLSRLSTTFVRTGVNKKGALIDRALIDCSCRFQQIAEVGPLSVIFPQKTIW